MNVTVPNTTQPLPTISNSIPLSKWEIQGRALKAQKLITMEMWEQIPPAHIKEMLYKDMLEVLMKSDCIEYTMQKDPTQMNMVRINARIFVTPDDQVRILRVNGVI